MRLPFAIVSLVSILLTTIPLAHAITPSSTPKPCTIHSPITGSFYDLRPLRLLPPSDPSASTAENTSYHVRGWDYPSNFTLNICGPVVEDLSSATGISSSRLHNISAFYRDESGIVFSIGQSNNQPIFRGKKLLLNYTKGSPCPELDEDGLPMLDEAIFARRKLITDDDEDDYDDDDDEHPLSSHRKARTSKKTSATRRKTTLLSLHCDTSPLLTSHPSISFLGTPDHCTYIFEIRSRYACAGATPATDSGSLGPGGVFGVIFGIAFLVYLIGGCVYQRSVMHQRGWRQLPNYSVWVGLGSLIGVSLVHFLKLDVLLRRVGKNEGDHGIGNPGAANGESGRGSGSFSANDECRRLWMPTTAAGGLEEEWPE